MSDKRPRVQECYPNIRLAVVVVGKEEMYGARVQVRSLFIQFHRHGRQRQTGAEVFALATCDRSRIVDLAMEGLSKCKSESGGRIK